MSSSAFSNSTALEQEWAPSMQAVIKASYPDPVFLIPTARRTNGRFTPADAIVQSRAGDYTALDPNSGHILEYHEAKIEHKDSRNFFIETWSNLADDPGRVREGWLTTCQADVLWYGFAATRTVHAIDWAGARRWLLGTVDGAQVGLAGFQVERLSTFPERVQAKHRQLNHTVGRLVPIRALQHAGFIRGTHTLPEPHP